jgi:hypothetical protein
VTAPERFGPASRVALYYAPEPDDPLWARGVAWLGRDPATGADVPQPDISGLDEITIDAAGYGFHATLKPPMRLRAGVGWADLLGAVTDLAASIPPFPLPPLDVVDLSGFLALHEAGPSPALQALCDACVAWVDHLRAPPTEAELAHRRRSRLSAAEDANLLRWGYQYVFSTWFFHMTLTRRLSPEAQAVFRPAAEAWFSPALAGPRMVEDIALFVQTEPGAPFDLVERVVLRGDR